MIDSIGPRLTAQSGPAAQLPTGQPGEVVVHRPVQQVAPTERIPSNAPTGPRPAFQHTYLEQMAALWPDEPARPFFEPEPEPEPEPEVAPAPVFAAPPAEDETPPTVDIRA